MFATAKATRESVGPVTLASEVQPTLVLAGQPMTALEAHVIQAWAIRNIKALVDQHMTVSAVHVMQG